MSTPEIDQTELLQIIVNYFNSADLQSLAFDLGVDYEDLAGESKASKARELIAYMLRRGKIPELIKAIHGMRPDISIEITSTPTKLNPEVEALSLNIELASLRQQIVELQKESLTNEQIEARIKEIVKTANRAVGQSEELKANLLLPPADITDVPLVPVHLLERLEEYRSDENIGFLLIGTFMGSVLGILSNWATNEDFIITRFSVVLMVLVIVLTIACIFWIRSIRQRADTVKKQMLLLKKHT